MPGRDNSGPMGQGSMTGRALGFCNGNEISSLKMQIKDINKTKEAIEKRLDELEKTVI